MAMIAPLSEIATIERLLFAAAQGDREETVFVALGKDGIDQAICQALDGCGDAAGFLHERADRRGDSARGRS